MTTFSLLGGSPRFDEWVPITRPWLPAMEELAPDLERILSSGLVTKGPYLEEFESRLSEYLGVRHVVAVSSCTLGLFLVYQAAGFTSGQVIVPSFTFMATAHPLLLAGATPAFADIDFSTWCLDSRAAENTIRSSTKGIVAVHNFGNPADIRALEALARENGLPLVFDSAHGFGALFEGQRLGAHGVAEVFSLSPTKLLIAGEGGVVATNDDSVAEHVRLGREYGNPGDYDSLFPGVNARLSEFHALLGLRSLDQLEEAARARNQNVDAFRARLGELPGLSFQHIRPDDRCSYKDFSVLVDREKFGLDRDLLASALRAENIDSRRYHYPPVHLHTAYSNLTSIDLPVTAAVSDNIISLPIWSRMDDRVIHGICDAIESCHANSEQIAERASTG